MAAPVGSSAASGTNPHYILKVGKEGEDRLTVQCDILNPPTLELLGSLGLGKESCVLDMGSGTGSIACEIASRYGCSVLGLDMSEPQLEIARANASQAEVDGLVRFEQCMADHLGTSYTEQFDVVMCRLFLCHLKNPVEIVKQMADRVKPGGYLVFEDIEADWKSGRYSCTPEHSSYNFWVELGNSYAELQGTDFAIGSKFAELIPEEFEVVTNKPYQSELKTTREKSIFRLGLQELASVFIQRGTKTQAEVEKAMADFENLEQGDFKPLYFPMVQFVAQKKAASDG